MLRSTPGWRLGGHCGARRPIQAVARFARGPRIGRQSQRVAAHVVGDVAIIARHLRGQQRIALAVGVPQEEHLHRELADFVTAGH